jgi:cytochrome c peroxidase
MIATLFLAACLPDTFSTFEMEQIEALRFDPDALPPGSDPDFDYPGAAALGELLFLDKTLSVDGSVSCDSCHDLETGVDPRGEAVSEGAGDFTARNAPTLLETAYRRRWGWAGQFCDLDAQNAFPLTNKNVYGHQTDAAHAVSEALLGGENADAFVAVFGPRPTAWDPDVVVADMGKALEAFVRTLPPSRTPLDRLLDGETEALDDAEVRGLKLFVGKGHCIDCHSGPLLSDEALHVTALAGADQGREAATDPCVLSPGEADPEPGTYAGAFVTPPLRNVAITAPYMHDGSLATLEEVVAHYDEGGDASSQTAGVPDPKIKPLFLSDAEQSDLVAFLASLGPTP